MDGAASPSGGTQVASGRPRLLDPIDRFSEALFGIIMVLTFTSSLSAVEGGREEMRPILVGAVCCNVAWGIVDAVMYLLARASEHGREERDLRAFRRAEDPARAREILAAALPASIREALGPDDLELLRDRVARSPDPPPVPRLSGADWLAALAVFLWVFAAALPLIAPFVLMTEPLRALRVSNGIALVLLFLTGVCLAHASGGRPWRTGLLMVGVGLALVGITIALGG